MWEMTLIGEERDFLYFSQLRDTIIALKLDAYISIGVNGNLYFSIASKEDLTGRLDYYIYEAIIKIAKRDFLLENLDCVGKDSLFDDFLLTSMIYIDLPQEVDYAKYSTKLQKITHVRSFLRFRLSGLISIWQDMIRDLNLSIDRNKNGTIYLDYLKFLANTSEPTYDVIYLNKDAQEIFLVDNKSRSIKKINSKDEVDVIVNLIIFSPKKIIINSVDILSDRLCNMIKYIFPDRVCLVL
ncbi:MAG: hypothetical protein E7354_01200 [Clostridiales bacterium]|nr:hypothetical protein [Clostridiales bacterium]